MKALNLTNNRYGLLRVLNRNKNNDKNGRPLWDCVCDCGNYTTVRTRDLVAGKTKSCGCLRKNKPKKEKTKSISKRDIIKQQRIGEEKYNNQGVLMKIIEYNSSQDIIVEFQDEYKYQKRCEYGNFTKGTVKNPYYRFLYNKGYIGVGKYCACNGKISTKEYEAWRKIFDRCYSENYHKNSPSYIDCEVCEEWCNFQNFAEWYSNHFVQIEDCVMQIDKDWKVAGNKIYSPETCEIVPSIINSCIVTHDPTKIFNLPRNIIYTSSKKYKPRLSEYGKMIELGTYENIEEAMQVYLDEKIRYIKELAEKYKKYLSKELYLAMINYKKRFIEENPEYAEIQ